MDLLSLLWDEHNERHIARHKVTPQEVEEVVWSDEAIFAVDDSHRRGRLHVYGPTIAGRLLLVVLDEPTSAGDAYVVTARRLKPREQRDYIEAREPNQTKGKERDQDHRRAGGATSPD